MTAILTALHSIVEVLDLDRNQAMLERISSERPTVHITTDRMDLAGCINGEYDQKTNKDLWDQLAYYHSLFDIYAEQSPRNSTGGQKQVDILASTVRVVMIDFLENQKEAKNL